MTTLRAMPLAIVRYSLSRSPSKFKACSILVGRYGAQSAGQPPPSVWAASMGSRPFSSGGNDDPFRHRGSHAITLGNEPKSSDGTIEGQDQRKDDDSASAARFSFRSFGSSGLAAANAGDSSESDTNQAENVPVVDASANQGGEEEEIANEEFKISEVEPASITDDEGVDPETVETPPEASTDFSNVTTASADAASADAAAAAGGDGVDGDGSLTPAARGPHDDLLHEFAPRIVVAGIGGAGGNAINNMIAKGLQGVDFMALNTDAQHLSTTLTDSRLQLGVELTRGLGCGANPDAGRMAAEECRDEISQRLQNAHMLFITAGMGGGTGTGAAPVVAEVAYEMGILTVAVVTLPFAFEGTHRKRLALEGVQRLQQVVDTLIVIPNQNLFSLADERTSFVDAFRMADDVLLGGVKSITDLMTSPGLINLDFADVQSVMHGMGNAILGTGVAEGDNRAIDAAQQALENPLLGFNMDISTAKGMLVNITGGADMTLFEVDRAAQFVTQRVLEPNANIIFGSAYDESLDGTIRVSVVATGIDQEPIQ